MTGRVEGKVVLITGGARGQGEAEARLLTAEGARVVIGDVLDEPGSKLASEIGDAALYTHLDVTSGSDWDAAVAKAVEHFGRLDGLVSNAGILRFAPIEQMSIEEYRQVIDVNQIGCFLGLKAAIPALRAAGGGSIVNISSIGGLEGIPGLSAYVSSKFAVRGMTKVAALELGHDGIRVNSVHPGGVDTPMVSLQDIPEDLEDSGYASQPIQRIGRPEEVAQLVLFLISEESSYCTGSEFVIDGGATAGRG